MIHKGTITIETERLILRQFELSDLQSIYDNCWNNYEVWKWTSYEHMNCITDVMNKANMFTEQWLGAYSRMNRYSWAIQIKQTGDVVGRLFGMHPDDELGEVELAYELGQKWWNQGLMTEAVSSLIEFFFTEVQMNRIYAYHADANPASGEVMKKCGMHYDETIASACKCNAGVYDKVCYSIYLKDYKGRI